MVYKLKISYIVCIFGMLLAASRHTIADTAGVEEFIKTMGRFGTHLFSNLAEEYPQKNIVISPFSIQTCIAMARMGAGGQTAAEIDYAFGLPDQEATTLAENYNAILREYKDSTILKMANKIYAMTGFAVREEFMRLLTEQFYSSLDFVDFGDNMAAAHTINTWVREATNGLIQNLVHPNSVDSSTSLVLVNAIHFKGNWVHPFSEEDTREEGFHLEDNSITTKRMMHIQQEFRYAESPDLNAKVLEMLYKDSDLALLVILPNPGSNLAELESKLKDTSLDDITRDMEPFDVIVDIPKFVTAFQAELSRSLYNMGMHLMFSHIADFGNMLEPDGGFKVSAVIHKAYIEVNEIGTEAAAATDMGVILGGLSFMNWFKKIKTFRADRPFSYIIKNSKNVILFKGRK